MAIEYLGLSEINGPLIALEGVKDAVLTAVWMDGTFLRKEYHESGGRLHLFVNNTFTELEFHTPVYDIGSGNSVELKEVWMIGKTND